MKKTLIFISRAAADAVFVNMAFYTAYLVRSGSVIHPPALEPYLHLWPYISLSHLIVFAVFNLYEDKKMDSRRKIVSAVLGASTVSILASMSITYCLRDLWGFIPSGVFVLAWGLNVILVSGWRVFVRYEK